MTNYENHITYEIIKLKAKELSIEIISELRRQIANWNRSRRLQAWDSINLGKASDAITLLLYQDHCLEGIAVYRIKRDCIIHSLVTKKSGFGYGTYLMTYIMKHAVRRKVGIFLESLDASIGFYEKLGLKCINEDTNIFSLSYQQLLDRMHNKRKVRVIEL